MMSCCDAELNNPCEKKLRIEKMLLCSLHPAIVVVTSNFDTFSFCPFAICFAVASPRHIIPIVFYTKAKKGPIMPECSLNLASRRSADWLVYCPSAEVIEYFSSPRSAIQFHTHSDPDIIWGYQYPNLNLKCER